MHAHSIWLCRSISVPPLLSTHLFKCCVLHSVVLRERHDGLYVCMWIVWLAYGNIMLQPYNRLTGYVVNRYSAHPFVYMLCGVVLVSPPISNGMWYASLLDKDGEIHIFTHVYMTRIHTIESHSYIGACISELSYWHLITRMDVDIRIRNDNNTSTSVILRMMTSICGGYSECFQLKF